MPSTAVALSSCLALLLAAPARAPSPGAARTIRSPEGITFAVPPGFEYELKTKGLYRGHLLRRGGAAVVITAVASDEAARCEATFTTRHALAGCAGEQPSGEAKGAFVALSSGAARVLVLAITDDGGAPRLAREVAETVAVSPALAAGREARAAALRRPDERLIGCFTQSSSTALSASSTLSILCLRQDSTFTLRTVVSVTARPLSPDASPVGHGDGADRGTWSAEPANDGGRVERWIVHFQYEGGTTASWNIRFHGGNLVRGERDLWMRSR